MKNKKSDDILLFLIKNSCYQPLPFTSAKEKYEKMKKAVRSKRNWFYDTDWYIRPFLVETSLLNNFLKIDNYDWNIIKPLYDKGLIWVTDGDGKICDESFSHLSEKFRIDAKKHTGLVRNYETEIDYFRFWIGNCNPNKLINETELVKIK